MRCAGVSSQGVLGASQHVHARENLDSALSLACRVSHACVGVSLSTHNLQANKFEQAKLNSEREGSSDVSLTSRLSRRGRPDRSQTYYGVPSMLGTPVLRQTVRKPGTLPILTCSVCTHFDSSITSASTRSKSSGCASMIWSSHASSSSVSSCWSNTSLRKTRRSSSSMVGGGAGGGGAGGGGAGGGGAGGGGGGDLRCWWRRCWRWRCAAPLAAGKSGRSSFGRFWRTRLCVAAAFVGVFCPPCSKSSSSPRNGPFGGGSPRSAGHPPRAYGFLERGCPD